ncbi:helix-turn-helix domain-containing protein [Herbidospora galbida]|uniref:helix-turn-helix domain-containing protein n=1 Tax=Herbidospora galbida TaxID=2575442 RepID=UPI00148581B4|nr:helix-turn-helix transcriptional regulator [Herbidospora galbida]
MPAPVELDPNASALAHFGVELRKWRQRRTKTQDDLASHANVTRALVSHFENARRQPTRTFVEAIDAFLDAGGALLAVWELVERSGSPEWFRGWIDAEQAASVLSQWAPTLFPGLLQTAAYARAVFLGRPRTPVEGIERAIAARVRRGQLLVGDDAPIYSAVLDWSVLDRHIGGPEVMSGQLSYLVDLYSAHRSITLQVLPADATTMVGYGGAFGLARTRSGAQTGYEDSVSRGRVLREQAEIAELEERYHLLRGHALSVVESMKIIREKAEQWQQQAFR